ncbi:MAG TPA: Nif3-like dinuclear metal center hexameric protein [Tissierellaceae bacterium]|nr:Nif3-like dinuclear metal center hexameric protein [Tissierellaceae bacterium]
MLKANEVIELMDKWAPPYLIDSWDNTGFQIGDKNQEINKILIALDLDRNIFDIAIDDGFDMVVTHHPIIFKPLKQITSENYEERLIMDIIKKDLVAYNAHSNLDVAINGVNDELAKVLGLKETKPLASTDIGDEDIGYGRIGKIDKIELKEFLPKIKERLDIKDIIVYGEIDKKIKDVAVCGGSGSGFIVDAYKNNADLYITGDIKYHNGQLAHDLGLTVVDAGHYGTEKIILPAIKKYLDEYLGEKVETKIVMESSIPRNIF